MTEPDEQAPHTSQQPVRIWVVTEEIGEYSDRYWSICAAFPSKELAERHATALAARPGFVGECSPGEEHEYAVVAVDLWEEPAEHQVVVFNLRCAIPPGTLGRWRPHPTIYRSVHVVRKGHEHTLWRATAGPSGESTHDPAWTEVVIALPTAEDVRAAYRRLAAEQHAAAEETDHGEA